MQELWILCMTHRLNVLYKCMKFRRNIYNGYQVIEQTQYCDGQTLLQLDRQDGTTYIDSITIIILCLLGNFSCFFVVCCFFFQNQLLEKFFQEYHQSVKWFGSRSIFMLFLSPEFFKINFFWEYLQCQTVWIQINFS